MTGPVFKTGGPSLGRRSVGSTPMRLRQIRKWEAARTQRASKSAETALGGELTQ